MRILMVQRFDVQTVGCATRVTHQAEELARRGHEVTLVHFPHAARRAEMALLRPLPADVEVVDLDRRAGALRRNVVRVAELARGRDLVHLWKCYPDAALPALYAACRCRLPLHYDWDDLEADTAHDLVGSRLLASLVGRWERFVPTLATTVGVASAALRERALALGVPPTHLFDAPVGAEPEVYEALAPAAGPWPFPLLIYVGQLEVASYAEQCVDALRVVREAFPDALLLVAGGGKRADPVAERAAAAGVTDAVRLLGYLDETSMRRYLLAADLALAPFEDTPLTRCKSPLKLCEYMAAGLPTVASEVGEARRLLGAAGAFVPPGDGAGLGRAALGLLRDDTLRESMSRTALERAQLTCHWRNHVDELERAYALAARG